MEILLTTLVLIIAPDCSDAMADTLRRDLGYNISPRYEVVCMGGVDILTIESVTLPLLREVYPANPIVFVYGKQQEWDYNIYLATKYRMDYDFRGVAGNTDVFLGYALAWYSHIAIQHERAHMETCSAHREGSDVYDPLTWTRTMERPWCSAGA